MAYVDTRFSRHFTDLIEAQNVGDSKKNGRIEQTVGESLSHLSEGTMSRLEELETAQAGRIDAHFSHLSELTTNSLAQQHNQIKRMSSLLASIVPRPESPRSPGFTTSEASADATKVQLGCNAPAQAATVPPPPSPKPRRGQLPGRQ